MSQPHHAIAVRDVPRVEIALLPAKSRYGALLKRLAKDMDAEVVPLDHVRPADLAERVVVVDLTKVMAVGALGPRAIAISPNRDLDCYQVVQPHEVEHRLGKVLKNLVELERMRHQVRLERETIDILNQFGLALSAISDRDELLQRMVRLACDVLRADGGSLYLHDEESGTLRFASSLNETVDFKPSRAELPIDERSMAGFVARRAEQLNVPNLYAIGPDVPYRPRFTFDRSTGYETRSVLMTPLLGRDGQLLGVLALVNRKTTPHAPIADFDRVLPFGEEHERIAQSIASQAAVSLENHKLYASLQSVFDSFVDAAVQIIEARDPSTAGHSHRVADLTIRMAQVCSVSEHAAFVGIKYTNQELEELRMASVLHDFGKVGVREEVLLKANRLYNWELREVEDRFKLAAVYATLENVGETLQAQNLGTELKELRHDLALVKRMNRASYRITPRDIDSLKRAVRRWQLPDIQEPVIRDDHYKRLCIPIGSLDAAERKEIQLHVEHTYRFLKAIPWTKGLESVPDLAGAHHEKLDGTGYPHGRAGNEIPFGAQLMTVADIFDALTAGDRPYKPAMPVEKALSILRHEVDAGHVNGEVVELLAAQRLWTCVLSESA